MCLPMIIRKKKIMGPFDLKEKHKNFGGVQFYRKISYEAFWKKGWILFNPLKFLWNGQFYRDFGGNLTRASTSFLWVYLSYLIPVFFLRFNQTVIHVFFLHFTILCFTLTFLSKSYIFSIPTFSQSCNSKGPYILKHT